MTNIAHNLFMNLLIIGIFLGKISIQVFAQINRFTFVPIIELQFFFVFVYKVLTEKMICKHLIYFYRLF